MKLTKHLITALLLTSFALYANAQQKNHYNVAIFLWDGAELLDFAGPGEVFAASGFNTYTVSLDGKEILSQGFVTVKPQYSMENAPVPDIVVFPGGGTNPVSKNQKILDWVKSRSAQGTFMLSVCTGAFILTNADLLKGKNVTTHYGSIEGLRSAHPELTVLENTRFVDNGNIITTAGISAGIDGALHLVSRIRGIDHATSTARYMEYDKWKPEEGRIDVENDFIRQLRTQFSAPESKASPLMPLPTGSAAPYEGELKNLAFELRDKGMFKEAAMVLEICVKMYPSSGKAYMELAKLYRKLGRPAPIESEAFIKMIEDGKVDEAVALYETEQKAFPGWLIFDHNALLHTGYYQYMYKDDFKNALKIFQMGAKAYPDSFYMFDSVGEAHLKLGNKKEAIANYRKSVELNPAHAEGKRIIAELEGKPY